MYTGVIQSKCLVSASLCSFNYFYYNFTTCFKLLLRLCFNTSFECSKKIPTISCNKYLLVLIAFRLLKSFTAGLIVYSLYLIFIRSWLCVLQGVFRSYFEKEKGDMYIRSSSHMHNDHRPCPVIFS